MKIGTKVPFPPHSITPKIKSSVIAIRKSGTELRKDAIPLITGSYHLSRLNAIAAPIVTPTIKESRRPVPTVNNVHGSLAAMIVITGTPGESSESPKSRRTTLPRYSKYWLTKGLSKSMENKKDARICASSYVRPYWTICSSMYCCTGFEGISRIKKKIIVVTTNTVTSIFINFFKRYTAVALYFTVVSPPRPDPPHTGQLQKVLLPVPDSADPVLTIFPLLQAHPRASF